MWEEQKIKMTQKWAVSGAFCFVQFSGKKWKKKADEIVFKVVRNSEILGLWGFKPGSLCQWNVSLGVNVTLVDFQVKPDALLSCT